MKIYFETLTDSRQESKIKHNMLEIIVMTICAVMADCDVWEDIADFCRVHQGWLKEQLNLELANGIPSHDTFQRIWSMLDPKEFEKCFQEWVSSVCQPTDREIISIDGKTLRGSKGVDTSALHLVSAWASKQQLVLGQVATEDKSNEITAVPKLLDALDVSHSIVTADAISCQKSIAAKVMEKQADYVFGLKENQPNLHSAVKAYFNAVAQAEPDYPEPAHKTTHDKGHGRIERRRYSLATDPLFLEDYPEWAGIGGIGCVESHVISAGKESFDTRYFITSLTNIDEFASAVRSHWGVESSLHWCLDVTFNEDRIRMRKDHSAENMAVVRHIALNLLKLHPSKMSLARKRRHCCYDFDFLAQVILLVHA